jgi:hypothetical protein
MRMGPSNESNPDAREESAAAGQSPVRTALASGEEVLRPQSSSASTGRRPASAGPARTGDGPARGPARAASAGPRRSLAGLPILPSSRPPADTAAMRVPTQPRPAWGEPLKIMLQALLRILGITR